MHQEPRKGRTLQKVAVSVLLAFLLVYLALIFHNTMPLQLENGADLSSTTNQKTITFALSSLAENEALLRYLDECQTENLKLEQVLIPSGEYNDQLNQLMLTGQAPDFFELSPVWIDSYCYKDWLLPIPQDLASLVPEACKAPLDVEPSVFATHVQTVWLVTNRALLESSGYASPPHTLLEMAQMAATVSKSQKGYGKYGFLYPFQVSMEESYLRLEQVCLAGGSSLYQWENHSYHLENMLPMLDSMGTMKDTGGLSIDYPLSTNRSALAQFMEGNIAMLFVNPLEIQQLQDANLEFSWDVSLPPVTENGTSPVCIETSAGFLAANRTSGDQLQELLPKLFCQPLLDAVAAQKGYVGIQSDASKTYNRFLPSETVQQMQVKRIWIENNRYSYARFSVYQELFEGTGDSASLESLSYTLSQNEGIRRKSKGAFK